MRAETIVEPAAHGHRKDILAVGCGQQTCPGMRNSEQHFTKRCHASKAMIGNPRTEEVRGKCAVHAAAENALGVVVAADISDSAQPTVEVVCDGLPASVQTEAVLTAPTRILTNVREPPEN